MLVYPFLFKGMMVMNYISYQKTMQISNGAGRERQVFRSFNNKLMLLCAQLRSFRLSADLFIPSM